MPAARSAFAVNRMAYACKVAVAAGLAWLVVWPWGGPADTYRYYAPLGAVVVIADSVTGSLRHVLSGAGAMVLGAALAVLGLALPAPEGVALAAVVLAGSFLAYRERLGPMSSWIPISALFVLIIGEDDPFAFLTAYVGLVVVGALVGLAVNLVWPALPGAQSSLDVLRDTLAAQLVDLAEGLLADPLPTAEEWREGHRGVDSRAEEAHRVVRAVREARRVNWRARTWREQAARQYRQAQALARLSFLVEDAFELVSRGEQAGTETPALGPLLRPSAAAALRSTAEVLSGVEDDAADPDLWHGARCSIDAFAHRLRERRLQTDEELFVAGSLVTTLRRVLDSVAPQR